MVLDRDYPITRRGAQLTILGLLIMAVIGVLLFGGFLPGIHPDFSGPDIVTLQGHQYYEAPTVLHVPIGLVNSTDPWNVTFHNVTFRLWLTNWYSGPGGLVNGDVTEPNGTSYPFVLGGYDLNGSRAFLYLSPDRFFGASWAGGPLGGPVAQLFVEV